MQPRRPPGLKGFAIAGDETLPPGRGAPRAQNQPAIHRPGPIMTGATGTTKKIHRAGGHIYVINLPGRGKAPLDGPSLSFPRSECPTSTAEASRGWARSSDSSHESGTRGGNAKRCKRRGRREPWGYCATPASRLKKDRRQHSPEKSSRAISGSGECPSRICRAGDTRRRGSFPCAMRCGKYSPRIRGVRPADPRTPSHPATCESFAGCSRDPP